jgi:Carboxypeptidase regulatory-like domain/TonB dependent receptor/TonB-dependent Receptor Plug Domain
MTFDSIAKPVMSCRRVSIARTFSSIFALLAAIVLLWGAAANAQLSGKGEIKGTVTDPTGAVVPGATVVATSNARGTKFTRKSTSAGDYDISPLEPDTYTITVTAPGFKTTTQENVVVNALEISDANISLALGTEDQSVTVSSAPPQLETSNATLGATMEQEMYSALPIQMGAAGAPDQRRASDFVTLMPGVQNNETANNQTDNTGPINGSGSKGGASSVYVDGVPFINVSEEGDNRFVWTAISVDSVNQLQVQTSGYSALYEGQGVQNYDVKSGTNKIHGAIYEYFRNTALDTWGFYSPGVIDPAVGHAVKPVEHQNEYGILLSGPIVKDKLFYFGNYDGFRYSKGAQPSLQTFPTIAETQGDFRGVAALLGDSTKPIIFDPTTGSSLSTRKPYMGCDGATINVICSTKFSQVAQNLQKLLPPASAYANQNPTNNFLAGLPFGLSNYTVTNRVDWVINPKHSMSFIGAFGRQASEGPAAQTTAGRNNGPLPFNYGQGYAPKTDVFLFEDTYTVSSHIVNQFKYGFARYDSPSFNLTNTPAYAASSFGITGVPDGQAAGAFPIVTFAGTDAPTNWAGDVGSLSVANSYNLIDNLQWVFGKHSVTFGGEIAWLQYQYTVDTGGSSPLTLATTQAETGGYTKGTTIDPTTGLSYASFLIGQIDKGSLTQNNVIETGARFRPISPYIQDDWKVNSRLTLNLGVRYDFYPTYTEAHNVLSAFNPKLTNPITGTLGALEFAGNGTGTCNCNTPVSNYYKNFGPRLGFAFQSDPKMVWRGSWGVMYTHGNAVGGNSISRNGTGTLGFSASPATNSVNGVPTFSLDEGFPAYAPALNVASGPAYGTGFTTVSGYTGTPQSVTYGDPYYGGRAPQYINYSFGFQRQLTDAMVLTMTYVGSQGHFESPDSNNARGEFINQLAPQYLSLGNNLATLVKNLPAGFFAANNLTLPPVFNTSQALSQALKPFPQYNSISDAYGNVANSNYHSLQVSLVQRPSKGLTFMFNYIWSKSIDDGGTYRSGYAIPAEFSNSGKSWAADRIERGVSTTNQPQHVVETGVWALPFGEGGMGGGNAWVRALAGGFKFSEIVQMYSGSPLAITGSACQTNPAQSTCNPTVESGFTGSARINGSWGHGATYSGSPSFISSKLFVPVSGPAATSINGPLAPEFTFGNAARTAPFGLYGPGNYNVDISLRRSFGIPHFERSHLTVEGDLYNVTNHTQFGGIGTTWGSTNFGQVSSQVNLSRDAQLSARFEF